MDISATGQKVFDYALQGTPLSEQGFFLFPGSFANALWAKLRMTFEEDFLHR